MVITTIKFALLQSPLPSLFICFCRRRCHRLFPRRPRASWFDGRDVTSCLCFAIKCNFFQRFTCFFSTNLNFIYGTTFSPDFFLNFSNSPKIPEKKFRPFTAATQCFCSFFCFLAFKVVGTKTRILPTRARSSVSAFSSSFTTATIGATAN